MKKHDNRGAAGGTLKKSLLPAYANDFSKHKKLNHYRISGYWKSKKMGNLLIMNVNWCSMSNIWLF